jgi:CheY-like chemotaxis protein
MTTKISETKPLRDRSILIVEDDNFISRIYSKWLIAAGAVIHVAHDGTQALRILKEEPVDLVLLDLGMPGLNGNDTVHLIRQEERLKELPVIVLSNATLALGDETYISLKDAGVVDILQKYSTSLTEIVNCIIKYLPAKETDVTSVAS